MFFNLTIAVSLIPIDFGEKGVYASYTRKVFLDRNYLIK